MEEMLAKDMEDLSKLFKISDEDKKAIAEADSAAEELVMPEYEHYMNHEFDSEAITIAKKHGIFGISLSSAYGGMNASELAHSISQIRLGQLGLGFATLFDVQTFIAIPSIYRWGSDAQREQYLKKMGTGDYIFAFALTEPEAGSDPNSMSTTYKKEDNRYLINGTKYLITNGSICDHVILFAKSESSGKITAFIIDAKAQGFSIEAQLKEKIGLYTSDTAMLGFENVEVDKDSVLGVEEHGLQVAYSALVNGRIGIGSACVGVIEASLKASLSRAKERIQHGKQIGKHQLIQQHISIIRQNLEASRWPIFHAAMLNDDYIKSNNDKALLEKLDLHSSLAKRIASRLAFDSADRAVQIHGGFGYSLMSPVGQLFGDSRVARIYEGTDEIQDLKIASDMLGEGFEAYK